MNLLSMTAGLSVALLVSGCGDAAAPADGSSSGSGGSNTANSQDAGVGGSSAGEGMAGAGGTDSGGTGGTSDSVAQGPLVVVPSATKIAVNGQLRLRAVVYDAAGAVRFSPGDGTLVVTWTSSDPDVVSVAPDGTLSGTGAGTAMVTAEIEGTSDSIDVPVEVVFSNISNLRLQPARVSIDVGATLQFAATASDSSGSPTSLDCAGSPVVTHDSATIGATYSGTLGAESISVTGARKGFSIMTLNCGGIHSNPVEIEVRPPVVIPNPSPSYTGDFGTHVDLALANQALHISSYDSVNETAVYSTFNGIWTTTTLSSSAQAGRNSQIVVDPLNANRPLICGIEGSDISCWSLGDSGFWTKHVVAPVIAAPGDAYTVLTLLMGDDGQAFMLFKDERSRLLNLAVSTTAGRDVWTTEPVLAAQAHATLALAADGTPRVAAQIDEGLVYGARDVSSSTGWSWEAIDLDTTSPLAGTAVRLAIGTDNRPQVVHVKGNTISYAIKSAGAWQKGTIESANVAANSIGFALDAFNRPRVSYYDAGNQALRYASRTLENNAYVWRVDAPAVAADPAGGWSALVVDELNRAQIAYHQGPDERVGLYVEPNFLDYTPAPALSQDTSANLDVAVPVPGYAIPSVVADQNTGYLFLNEVLTDVSFQGGSDACEALTAADRSNWRYPTESELNAGCQAGVFIGVTAKVWTSTLTGQVSEIGVYRTIDINPGPTCTLGTNSEFFTAGPQQGSPVENGATCISSEP